MAAARIVLLSANNNVLVDARLLRYMVAADRLGHEAIAIGTTRLGPDEEHQVPGGRAIVKRLPGRFVGRGAAARLGAWHRALAPYALNASPGEARALAAFLTRPTGGDGTKAAAWARRAHSLGIRALVKARLAVAGRLAPAASGKTAAAYGAAESHERKRARALAFYRRAPLAARWRIVTPEHIEEELAIGPLLDQLAPDVIHVHDVYLMGVAAAAAARAGTAGRRVRLVYDAREFVPGLAATAPRRVAAQANLEREFIGRFERVITVSDSLADRLVAEHRLARRPDLVLNAPIAAPRRAGTPAIRQAAGLADGARLMVYGGGVNPARGVQTAIAALAALPKTHLAVVIRQTRWMPPELLELADRLGVADRLHLVPFVDHDQVVSYFESADLGLSPLLHTVNHDVALTNKFCEYLAAGLPIVTSDTPEQARLVRELDLGAVHRAGDAADLARAAAETFDRLPELKERIASDAELRRRFSWDAQVPVLERVYREVLAS
ncbi:MAG: glycosyltransferase family 4 protein [Bifidobacteriaceae bacterium]|nr:glycosyltransferase family 4 protein [Bifidobacteriaceae bacterium]